MSDEQTSKFERWVPTIVRLLAAGMSLAMARWLVEFTLPEERGFDADSTAVFHPIVALVPYVFFTAMVSLGAWRPKPGKHVFHPAEVSGLWEQVAAIVLGLGGAIALILGRSVEMPSLNRFISAAVMAIGLGSLTGHLIQRLFRRPNEIGPSN
ncbi:hypothetical protein ABI59_10020 [Acidobacteria bacterium Mor1]|nr:hypothetical protein ABI59_10020 [Acidobacteria bacterium Mor1]